MTAGAVSVPTIVPLRAPIPGQHKTCIDTNTKIELRSETPHVTIFYSTNGKNPAPFQKHGPEAKSTFKYREPFRLPGGKRSVKAVAIAEDGIRESFVVTKTFDVQQLTPDPLDREDDGTLFIDDIPANEMAKQEMKKFSHKMMTSQQAWADIERTKSAQNMMQDMTTGGNNRHRVGTGTRHLHSRMGPVSARATVGQGTVADFHDDRPKWNPPDTATQALRLQRETDFLKCVYCFAPRPADPYSRFCHDCGNPVPPLPQTRMPPPEPGQMGTCVHCKSLVPFNTPTCLICEAPIPQQNTPQASIRLANKAVCVSCGTANPANVTTCITCEARLPNIPAQHLHHGGSAPSVPKGLDRLLTCTKCGRVNNPDARFCDWCGTKPQPPSASLVCSKCHGNNNPYAKFCASCGVVLEPPMRPELRNAGIEINVDQSTIHKSGAQWLPISIPLNPIPKCDMSTQTTGLFYPSTKEINKRTEDEEDRLAMERMARDRKPLMTAISPGRGYWRKQMEHICTHLKAHAQNNPEFRALIGEPRMGKVISTAVHEDGYELSITVNFALRGTKDPFIGERGTSLSKREYLSSSLRKASMSSYGSQESLVTPGRSTARSRTGAKRKGTKKPKRKPKPAEESLTVEDKKLLKEIGKNGEGEADEVQQLLEEGADPNCVNKDNVPALHLAVQNKHLDAIPILIQEGAEVNANGPNHGNTALHEAVMMAGTTGKDLVDILLGCGASTQSKNNKGETAYDLALKENRESIANQLAASVGQSALDKLLKPKHSTAEF